MDHTMPQGTDGRRRFADTVRIEAMNGGFIRADEERRLLQDGMARYNLSLEEARGVLLSTVNDQGFSLQRATEAEIRDLILVQSARNRGRRLSKAEFQQAVEMYRAKTKGRVTVDEARLRVKAIMDENNVQPKRAGWVIRSRRWYNSIKAT
ncbi:hypothetical protein BAL199_24139 [alpha proteobacterium BAL199]|jgi:hypothetical protein|nr:hypothetical protein BAL199_24139 [alpha proteobacterium BAL199]